MKQSQANFRTMSIFVKMTLLFVVIFLLSSCQGVQDDFSGIVGTKAPAFTLYNTEGNKVNLMDYKDKVVVLFFFGNACPKCKAEAPDLQKILVNPYTDFDDYVVLGLDYWNGDPAAVKAFKKETGINIPMLLDAGNVGTNYKTSYDRLVVIDKDGNIVFSGTQEASKDMSSAKAIVDNLHAYYSGVAPKK
jgi:peroxiredoxin